MKVIVRPDGASRGNPGPAAIGVVVEDQEGRVLREIAGTIGRATNNVAEYRAILTGLKAALELGADAVELRTDSELVGRQLQGTYRVHSPVLRRLHDQAKRILGAFREVEIRTVPREENARADRLANQALDQAKGTRVRKRRV